MNKALLGASDAVLNALPLPVIMVAADGKIADANVASFDSGYGSALLARHVGQKRAAAAMGEHARIRPT